MRNLSNLIRVSEKTFNSSDWLGLFTNISKNFKNNWLDKSNIFNKSLDKSLSPILGSLKNIEENDLGERSKTTNEVGYTEIYISNNFHMTVFQIPPGKMIPLHDHPGMCVITKLLQGELESLSYTRKGNTKATFEEQKYLTKGDVNIVYPFYGNIHEFHVPSTSKENCILFDIIAPPYSVEKPCTYFSYQQKPSLLLKNNLAEIRCPDEFHTERFEYF